MPIDGASIVFDNAVTNIGEGNLTQSSMGIMVTGAASKVIFTENADSLKINSATGIYVNGGSFSFDNTEGSVLIENNPEDRKRDTGRSGNRGSWRQSDAERQGNRHQNYRC